MIQTAAATSGMMNHEVLLSAFSPGPGGIQGSSEEEERGSGDQAGKGDDHDIPVLHMAEFMGKDRLQLFLVEHGAKAGGDGDNRVFCIPSRRKGIRDGRIRDGQPWPGNSGDGAETGQGLIETAVLPAPRLPGHPWRRVPSGPRKNTGAGAQSSQLRRAGGYLSRYMPAPR